jgi:starch phosphorylase
LRLVTDKKGQPLVATVQIGNDTVRCQGWALDVGRVTVYLLDTDLPENDQRFRNLTAHVYGGDQWTRISQEIVLGIGGVRFLRALGITPSVFHMNEGHSAFLTLELLREQIEAGTPAEEAGRRVKGQCVFTTHTPVPAGHDRFDQGLVGAALPAFAASLGMPVDRLMGFGRIHPQNGGEAFTMTVLALRMSRGANGVSELHGHTSQEMWKDLFPGKPVSQVPIGGVTNGVHLGGWTTLTASRFWTNHLGAGWATHLREKKYWQKALSRAAVSDEDLWTLRLILRREMIEFVRQRMREQALRTGADADRVDQLLSPDVLTIGFARRFATYKRAPLIFRDFEWAVRILANAERPVQLIFAGKAHPRDDAGKQFIQHIIHTARRPELASRVVFLEDYDINVARHLVSGSDIWLNTPRRPMEACGTSGMKTIMHGCLHLSTMDGWWREAYDGGNGWKIGEDTTASSEQLQDDLDAASLRSVLENKILPLFYDRGKDGIPKGWIKVIRQAITSLAPVYNTDRMVAEYTTDYYLAK